MSWSTNSHESAVPSDRAYEYWAKQVDLDPVAHTIDNNSRPDLVKLMTDYSFVPSWVLTEGSPEYSSYRDGMYKTVINTLASSERFKSQLDPSQDLSLEQDLSHSLLNILKVAYMNAHFFGAPGPEPTEADRRSPLDNISTDIWVVQSNNQFFSKMECPLQVPAFCRGSDEIKPDLSAFITLSVELLNQPVNISRSCASIASNSVPWVEYALHWVTEYKQKLDKTASRRQVVEGLVTGLYQRRSLGFMDHGIFGMAHHSATQVDIIAAFWELDDSTEQDTRSAHNNNGPNYSSAQATAQSTSQEVENSLVAGNTNSGMSNDNNNEGQMVKKAQRKHKIVLYDLATFHVQAAEDVLLLYLLMRSVRKLGLKYQNDINSNCESRIKQLIKLAKQNYGWPKKPTPGLPDKKSGKTSKRRKTMHVPPTINKRRCDWNHSPYFNPSAMYSMPPPEEPDMGSDSDSEECDSDSDAMSVDDYDVEKHYYTNFLDEAKRRAGLASHEA